MLCKYMYLYLKVLNEAFPTPLRSLIKITIIFPRSHTRSLSQCCLLYGSDLLSVNYLLKKTVSIPFFKYLVAHATLFDLFFHRLILTRVHFTYSNFAWGLHGGVDGKWCRGLFVLDLH